MKRGIRICYSAIALAVAPFAHAQTFTTDLKGLGTSGPIGLTPLNAPDVSVMSVQYLTQTDPEVRLQ